MTRALALALGLAGTIAGCGGTYRSAQPPSQPTEPGSIDINKASMPFQVLRAEGGQEIPVEAFVDEVAAASAVCVGESHSNPHHHWAQLWLVEQMAERGQGRRVALGMEMFQRPFQGVLDDYAAGRIDQAALLSRSGWSERWGFDFALYGPIIDTAVAQGMALLALNIANELRRKFSRQGMDSLTEAERTRIPELDLDNEEHKAWFMQEMAALGHKHGHGHGKSKPEPEPENEPEAESRDEPEGAGHPHPAKPPAGHPHPAKPPAGHPHPAKPPAGHPHPSKPPAGHEGDETGHPHPHGHGARSAESIYATQVLWDETMAETAADWLAGGQGRQVIILAGNGHCHDSAIVSRMRRRGVESVVSVRPIIDDGQGNVAAELARPLTDYLFVMTPPRSDAP